MARLALFALSVALTCLLAACGGEAPPPTSSVAISTVSVAIGPVEPDEFVAAGQRVALIAQSNPVDVSFAWQLNGSGELTQTEGPAVQYVAPASVTVEETVSVIVTIEDAATGQMASADLIIRLLPAQPSPAVASANTPASSSGGQAPATATVRSSSIDGTPAPRATSAAQPTGCPDFTSKQYGRAALPDSALDGQIQAPSHCLTGIPAETAIEVSGTVGPVPTDTFIWLMINANNGRYYPQCAASTPDSCPVGEGNWVGRAYLGRAGCKENFTLALIAVDGEADEFLKATMSDWFSTGDYLGLNHSAMNGLGAEEIAVVQVETAGVECP